MHEKIRLQKNNFLETIPKVTIPVTHYVYVIII